MSHDATNWAIKQRGIKPAVKIVLWHLCDCHNPAYGGAFPSQEYLSEQCEIPRSTLNVYLDQLEEMGLILREQRRKIGSKQMERTRYYFPFDPGYLTKKAENPCPETGHGEAKAESRNQPEPSPENGESHVQNLDSNLVKEPVREPVIERERASDLEAKRIEREFKAWYPTWPTYVGDSEDAARREWQKLTAEDRARCIDRTPTYIGAVKANKGKFTYSSVYLKGKAWEKLEDPKSAVALPSPHNAFSKAWFALRLVDLLKPAYGRMPPLTWFQQKEMEAGGEKAEQFRLDRLKNYGWPKVLTMHQRAQNAQGATVLASIAALSEGFVKVHKDSQLAQRWFFLHEVRGWPWMPVPENVEWLFFPAGHPEDAISEFEQAISEGRGNDDAA